MSVSVHKDALHLKVCEWSPELGATPYIAFEEYLTIPGLENADIRLEFANKPSLAEVEDLRRRHKKCWNGLRGSANPTLIQRSLILRTIETIT